MDISELKAKALAARTVRVEVGGCTFSLRIPTEHEAVLTVRRIGGGNLAGDGAGMLIFQRACLEQAIVGWQGPRISHVLSDDPAETDPLAWSVETVPLLLDAQPDWGRELGNALNDHMAQRRKVTQADAKN
jgi:hypothetical protein